ncbi:hypothetical protein BN938_2211 [Mucinivorans hirudinis]|uniref:Uncharacterized protein n=1 Tax=Mucinivorans hirudinis TaxID=1433126 RepID=A0A060RDJ2_9BACT|nr:hypothetical protein BN938_2211 [Mucinivorans hirudinis]
MSQKRITNHNITYHNQKNHAAKVEIFFEIIEIIISFA